MYKYFRNPKEDQKDVEPYALRGGERPECLLFAEGATEALFLDKWLQIKGADSARVAVVGMGGLKISTLLTRLSEDENFSLVHGFGFFVDAEKGSAAQRAAMVASALQNISLLPNDEGLVPGQLKTQDGRKFAVFVSPNNAGSGFIEHLVLQEIATTDLGECIDRLKGCAEARIGSAISPKALVQAYIGIRKVGTCGTGRGFHSSTLQVMHDAYAPIRATLEQVL